MICSEFTELLDNYESLSESEHLELEKHAEECESCGKELEFFKSIISISASIPVPEVPESLIDDVNAKLDRERTPFILLKSNLRLISTVAACLAVGVAVGLNNGFIKKNIDRKSADGVISETVITATQAPAGETDTGAVVTPTAAPEAEPVVEAPQPKQEKEPTVTSAAKKKPEKTPENTATAAPATEPPAATVAPTQKPVDKPVAAPEPTPDIHDASDYEVAEAPDEEYAYHRRRSSTNNMSNAFSDYLYVESQDMGAVVSTMSEMGFRVSSGYYMGTRDDFYALIDRLSAQGIGYECTLKYNTGDTVAFSLQYS